MERDALHANDAIDQFRRQQAVVGRFSGQPAQGGQPHVDGGGGQVFSPEVLYETLHGGFGKPFAGSVGGIPGEKFRQRFVVGAAGMRRLHGVKHQGFNPGEVGGGMRNEIGSAGKHLQCDR